MMPNQEKQTEQALHAEISRLNKIIEALMNRAEQNTSLQGSDFNLFQAAITLENQVRRRTAELEDVRQSMEKITRALRESENRYRLMVENSPVSIHEIDRDGRITSMNRAGLLMRGVQYESELQGTSCLDVVRAEDRDRIGKFLADACAGKTSHFEFHARGAQGKIFKSCFVPIRNKKGEIEKLMGITEDITARKRAEKQVRKLAFYDTLTQLPNRRLLMDRLNQAMAVSKRNNQYGAVMFLDLDNFKPLNDTYGHDMGDLLLIEVANRISRHVRETDTVARLGGDEFVVLLSDLDAELNRSVDKAGIVAEKIRAVLAQPYNLANKQGKDVGATVKHHCSSSIGVALFFGHEVNRGILLRRADMAMYQAKADGRNKIRFFDGQSCQ